MGVATIGILNEAAEGVVGTNLERRRARVCGGGEYERVRSMGWRENSIKCERGGKYEG